MAERAEAPEIYTCCHCGVVFETAWSEEDARAELEQRFPGVAVEDCHVVCDGCDALMQQAAEMLNAVRRDILRLLGVSPN